jgi:hypothetical protein
MALHGWNDLAAKLHHMSKTGQWKQMAAEIPDDVLDEFAAYATYDELPKAIEKRFGGISDTVEFGFETDTDVDFAREVIGHVNQIESRFEAPADHYA